MTVKYLLGLLDWHNTPVSFCVYVYLHVCVYVCAYGDTHTSINIYKVTLSQKDLFSFIDCSIEHRIGASQLSPFLKDQPL